MHGAGAAADGLRQRLPRAARAGAHRRRRAPAARGAHRDSLDAPRVRARPGGRRGLGCLQSIQNCSVTAAGGACRDPSSAAVLARRGQCGARPAVGARRRSQCRRRASARLARRGKLFRFPRLAPVSVNTQVLSQSFTQKLRACYALTKPRVVSLIVFTAVIGMFLAPPGVVPIQILIAGTAGIALVAGAAAAINCLLEQKIDAVMQRTRWRPLPRGELTVQQTLVFTAAIGSLGLWLLYRFVNPLTMWLTVATFIGYAIVYTVLLKPATPQNIVIGGASGAMPPVLGWAAVTGEVTTEAILLFLIIFAWTPPHFWSLALYRTEDYARAGVPMLPVTHGRDYTRLQVLLYTLILFAVTLLPYVVRMSGLLYLFAALALGGVFIGYALRIYLAYSDSLAQKTFRYSIAYLALLFAALLVDHYL